MGLHIGGVGRREGTRPMLVEVAQRSGLVVVLLARGALKAGRAHSVHSAIRDWQHLLARLCLPAAHLVAGLVLQGKDSPVQA